MLDTRPIRFGIVGCGSASVPVCEALTQSSATELVAVHDVNETLAEDLCRRFQVQKHSTLDDLLSDSLVDAVYVAVPHHLLAPLTHRILKAGKHALTEKPLALSVEQIDALEALAVQQGLTLGVFYEMRYAPAHTPARKLIQGGAIGRIIGIQIQTLIDKPLSYWQAGYTGRSIHPWRGIRAQAGGGVVLMNTSHLLDALLYITGLRVVAVSAEVATLLSDVEVEDMAAATIRFDNGAIGSLIAGAHISGARSEEFCRFYGTNGQIRLPDPYGTDPMQIYVKEAWGDLPGEQWHTLEMQPAPVYRLALEDFARAVQCQGPAPIDTSDARQVLTTVLSLYQSAVEKRTVSIS